MAQQLGENITIEVKDGKAIITIDLEHRVRLLVQASLLLLPALAAIRPYPEPM
jgi:hypothetical protein